MEAQASNGEASASTSARPLGDPNSGKGIPGWVLRVEGRLLDVSDN